MAGIFSLHLPRLSLEALRALGSSFSFALTPAHMAGVFSLHLPRLSLEALCALGSSFFALTPAPAAGFLQLPLRLGLRRRRLDPRYEAGTVSTGFMKIRNRRNASVCRLSKN